MRTQTKIRNKKILGWMFELLFWAATACSVTMAYQKFKSDQTKTQGLSQLSAAKHIGKNNGGGQ